MRKRKALVIPSRIKVFNSIQNGTYLQSNVYLSLGKSATVSFCQYDVIMKIVDALQLQERRIMHFLTIKLHFINKFMKKYKMDHLFNIGTAYKILYIYNLENSW